MVDAGYGTGGTQAARQKAKTILQEKGWRTGNHWQNSVTPRDASGAGTGIGALRAT